MVTNKLLFLLVVIGLTAGCGAGTASPRDIEPSPTWSLISSPIPTQTRFSETEPAGGTPEAPADRVAPDLPTPVEGRPPAMPPAVEDISPPTPVEAARADLAHRLHTDIAWVEVVGVATRAPDAGVMPCLASDAVAEELWVNLSEVEWISLSVKGNVHHYVALGAWVIYCDDVR